MKNPTYKRTDGQRARDRVLIAKWMTEGKTLSWITENLQKETGAKYKLSINQIYYDQQKIITQCNERSEDVLTSAIEEIERLILEAFESFKQCQAQEKSHAFRYLEVITNLVKEKNKIMGLHQDDKKLPDQQLNINITLPTSESD